MPFATAALFIPAPAEAGTRLVDALSVADRQIRGKLEQIPSPHGSRHPHVLLKLSLAPTASAPKDYVRYERLLNIFYEACLRLNSSASLGIGLHLSLAVGDPGWLAHELERHPDVLRRLCVLFVELLAPVHAEAVPLPVGAPVRLFAVACAGSFVFEDVCERVRATHGKCAQMQRLLHGVSFSEAGLTASAMTALLKEVVEAKFDPRGRELDKKGITRRYFSGSAWA
ncbi:hypothetical protein HDZ31DRAFT_76342 [Schizophyllum fasciatum]